MAGQTLSAGSPGRGRVLFGLLDGDGWTWAILKAAFWFVTIIMLLGYIPDRAYYFTVFSTIDLGVNVISPINFCPPSNRTLPCPAPAGAPLPWQPRPSELALPGRGPTARVVQAGTNLIYIGGTDGNDRLRPDLHGAACSAARSARGRGPLKLPAPRTDAAAVFLNSSIYVIGGFGADGKPTSTVYVSTQDATTGAVRRRIAEDTALAPACAARVGDRRGRVGRPDRRGRDRRQGPTTRSGRRPPTRPASSAPGRPRLALPQPRSEALAAIIGSELFVYGGRDATGPTAIVLRGRHWHAAAVPQPAPPGRRRRPIQRLTAAGAPGSARPTCRSPGRRPPGSPRTA